MPGFRENDCGPAWSVWPQKHGVIGDIRGKGLFQGIEFVKDPAHKERFPACYGFRRAGRTSGRCRMACCAGLTRTGSLWARR